MLEEGARPPQHRSAVAPFLRLLRTVERYQLRDLVMHQARRIEPIVRHARRNVPFYAERLKPVLDSEDVLDLAGWQQVPILTNAEARKNAPAMIAVAVPDIAGQAVEDQTSGTGGESFRFYRSTTAVNADAANSLRIFVDHGFDMDRRLADLRIDVRSRAPYPEGALRPNWSFGHGHGDYAILDINTAVADQVEWLVRMQPALMFTWAMNARAIALALEATGRQLPLKALATSAETCTAGVRADCRRVFGVDPVDIFGVREIGIVAWQCHAGPFYHLAAESAFIEVIGEDGMPARPGGTGKVVATAFYNYHMPFIRYATGDYVTLAKGTCPCGRTLPVLSTILGRDRNRMGLPDGTRIFPSVPEAALDRLIGPLRWRLVQQEMTRVLVMVEPSVMARAQSAAREITLVVREALGSELSVELRIYEPAPAAQWRKKRELFSTRPS